MSLPRTSRIEIAPRPMLLPSRTISASTGSQTMLSGTRTGALDCVWLAARGEGAGDDSFEIDEFETCGAAAAPGT